MPLYHSSASCIGVGSVIFTGAAAAIGRRFSTTSFWKEIRETGATIFMYVGETCRYLTAAPPELDPVTGENLDKKHKVRVALGNGLRPDVWDKFKSRFGIEVCAPPRGLAQKGPLRHRHVPLAYTDGTLTDHL